MAALFVVVVLRHVFAFLYYLIIPTVHECCGSVSLYAGVCACLLRVEVVLLRRGMSCYIDRMSYRSRQTTTVIPILWVFLRWSLPPETRHRSCHGAFVLVSCFFSRACVVSKSSEWVLILPLLLCITIEPRVILFFFNCFFFLVCLERYWLNMGCFASR